MLKDFFVKQGIKEAQIDEFIRTEFPQGDYSRTELQRTPLGIKIIIYTNKPGRIIGRGGKNINQITEAIKRRFELENPQLDVRTIRNPNLDSAIVSKQIAEAIERGYNYKKIGNLTLKRILGAGAVGAEIVISGKLTGGKGMTSKFIDGYLKHSGHTGKVNVDTAFFEAKTKPGIIGVRVKIMKDFVDISGELLPKADKLALTGDQRGKNKDVKAEDAKDEKSEKKSESDKKEDESKKQKKDVKPAKKTDKKPEKKTKTVKKKSVKKDSKKKETKKK